VTLPPVGALARFAHPPDTSGDAPTGVENSLPGRKDLIVSEIGDEYLSTPSLSSRPRPLARPRPGPLSPRAGWWATRDSNPEPTDAPRTC
jgi:hypothetical protein